MRDRIAVNFMGDRPDWIPTGPGQVGVNAAVNERRNLAVRHSAYKQSKKQEPEEPDELLFSQADIA